MEQKLTVIIEAIDDLINDIQEFISVSAVRDRMDQQEISDRTLDLWVKASNIKGLVEN